MPYRYLDHTADLGIEVEAPSIEELFIDTAKAIFETQIDGAILENKELTFEISSVSLEELLIEWCRELIYNFSVNGFIPAVYKVEIKPDYKLKAFLKGDIFTPGRHRIKLEVKNATYHNLFIQRKDNLYHARIIFDV
ncbi:MAG: archease [candidate division WOR-3 bacterium]